MFATVVHAKITGIAQIRGNKEKEVQRSPDPAVGEIKPGYGACKSLAPAVRR